MSDLDADARSLRHDTHESALDAGGLTNLLRGSIADVAPFPAGTRLGDVTLVRLIAEGGMGRVYEGLQGMPCRSVAVKVIRPGLVSSVAMRRFEFEAQTLGRLTHPAIAHIYSMGVETVGGAAMPYFVMEYVEDAKPVTVFAADRSLSVRDRVALFREACRAVAHGHAKGVIHRDLKPGNILVDSRGQVKVIDFGVARSTDGDAALTTVHTAVGQLVGTLCYMAPEQFHDAAQDLDVRADVYALGVVLHELLSGSLPYDLEGRPAFEVARVISQEEPRSLSAGRPQLRGDISTIVATCLAKDRDRRYSTAAELEADLGRFVRGEPIAASPPGFLESLRRVARRHRLAAAAAVGVTAAFVIAFVGISMFAVRAQRLREAAEREQVRADAEANTSRQRLYIANLRSLRACLDSRNLRMARQLYADNRGIVSDPLPLEMNVLGAALDDAVQVITTDEGAAANIAYGPDGGVLAAAFATPTRVSLAPIRVHPLHDVTTSSPKFVFFSSSRLPYQRVETVAEPWAQTWIARGGRPPGLGTRTSRDSATLAVSADGRRAAMQQVNGRVRIVASGADEGREIASHEGRVLAAALSPAGDRLAMQGIDGTLRLWDADSGACLGRCGAATDQAQMFLFSPDGSRLAAVIGRTGPMQIVTIIDTADARLIGQGEKPQPRASSRSIIVFSPDGRRLATGLPDGRVMAWDTSNASVAMAVQDHLAEISSLAYSPDGKSLVSGAANGHLHVRDAATGALDRRLLAHDGPVIALAFHADGDTLASGAEDGTIRTWSLTAPLPLAALPGTRGLAAAAFSPDGRRLVVVPRDGVDAEMWDVATVQPAATLAHAGGTSACVAWSPDGRMLAATITAPDRRGDVGVWEARTGNLAATLSMDGQSVASLAFSGDGSRILVGGRDGRFVVWDAVNGRRVVDMPPLQKEMNEDPGVVFGLGGSVVAGSRANLVDGAGAGFRGTLPARGKVTALAVSPDGAILASGMAMGSIYVQDLATGRDVHYLTGPASRVRVVCFSRDGRHLASGAADGSLRVWDVASGKTLATIQGHEAAVESLGFASDDRRLVSTSADGTTRIWDAASGQELCSLASHSSTPRAMAVSPDGRVLVIASPEGVVRLWGISNAEIAAARVGIMGRP